MSDAKHTPALLDVYTGKDFGEPIVITDPTVDKDGFMRIIDWEGKANGVGPVMLDQAYTFAGNLSAFGDIMAAYRKAIGR